MIDEFTTLRLSARRLRADDFPDFHALHQDPKVMAWLSADGAVLSETPSRQALQRNLDHWQQHGFGLWLFRTKADDQFVGRAGVRRTIVEGRPEVELSYAIGSEWWGQGLTTEMGEAIVRLAFERLGIDALISYTLPPNRRSRRVMEKLGFVVERDFIHAELPHVLYRLNRATMNNLSARPFLSCVQVRDIDRRAVSEYGMSPLVLMENAGRGAAEALLALGVHGPVIVCCGKGNNGGDGLVIARHLHNAEIEVKVLLFAAPADLSPDAAANWQTVERAGIPAEVWPDFDDAQLAAELGRAEWAVDALLGTGLQGPVRPPLDRVIGALNAGPARIFAVDIPSGLDGDSGDPLGPTVRAHDSATFMASKMGFTNPAATTWLGTVHVIDIGVPRRLLIESAKPPSETG